MPIKQGFATLALLALAGALHAGECSVEEILQLRDAGFSAERITELCDARADAPAEAAVALRILYFRSDKPSVIEGDSATLEWATEGASEVQISGIGAVEPSGTRTITPLSDGPHYQLTASGPDGEQVSAELSIAVSYLQQIDPGRASGGALANPAHRDPQEPQRPVLQLPVPAIVGQLLQPLQQDCVGIAWQQAEVVERGGRWLIRAGGQLIKNFGPQRDEARQALRILRRYRLDQQCFVGRPNPSMEYFLVDGRAPRGSLPGEDCVRFDPEAVSAERVGQSWKIVEGSHWIMDFGDKGAEARQALRLIRHHGFTRQCFVGRPQPSFVYLRR